MRTRYMISAALLLLASASVAGAQQKAAAPAKAPAWDQTWELGFRSTTTTGDEARYQRYQDLKSGLASKIGIGKETDASAFDFSAGNVGNDDQFYSINYNQFGKLKISLDYTGQPLNYAYNTKTAYRYAGNNVWTLDPTLRAKVQAKTAGVIGIVSTAAQYAGDSASIYRSIAVNFPMSAQRNQLALALKYRLNDVTNVDFSFKNIKKSGNQPWGAAFAFNNAEELPMALDNSTNELTAGIEYNKPAWGMVRAEYQGSFFKNQFSTLTWDSPLFATDYSNGKTPPNGPWDASGYSNGNGPAKGAMSMPPSSQMNMFRVLGLYKMPGHTVLNGQIAYVSMTQDEALMPFTTNANIANAATYLYFPGLAALPRASAQAEVKGLNALINFSTRPTDYFAFDMKYRFNDHENSTPFYDYSYSVRFDAVPEYLPGEGTEHFNIRQNTMEAGATFMLPHKFTQAKIGYIMDDFKREGRAFGDMTDYTFRFSLDAYQNKYGTLRGIFEKTSRVGSGFSQEYVEETGSQGGIRFYDEADMDRTKSQVILSLNPTNKFDVNLTFAAMDDKYSGEGHEFGLLSNKTTSTSVTANFYPNDKVTLGVNYGMDKVTTNQMSRNANPITAGALYQSFTDPARNWSLDNAEDVKTAGAFVELTKLFPNTDVKFSYNYSNSDNAFNFGGPRLTALVNNSILTTGDTKPCTTSLAGVVLVPCFIAEPNVTNTWTQMKVDVKHMFRANIGVGVGYWYEKLDIKDFATTNLADGSPRIDPLGALTTGYGNRPYTGGTLIAKLIYMF